MNASVIKRIIGLEGDFIKCVDGDIIQIPRGMLSVAYFPFTLYIFFFFIYSFLFSLGYCWLEGDNRPRSIDSNSYGPIPINLIEVFLSFIFYFNSK